MPNFEHEIQTDLTIKVIWKYPAKSEDEQQYRNNIEMAYQEISLRALVKIEESNRINEKLFAEKLQKLWDEANP